MDKNKSYPVANLSQDKLEQMQKFEQVLREETGEEIVLIAYEHKK